MELGRGAYLAPGVGSTTYLDPMLESLRQSGYGCSIGSHFFGALAYADDIMIMATSVQGLQEMVKLCEEHATENDLVFSTDADPRKSKTMCMAFNCQNKEQLASIRLNNDDLPWVSRAKHIGNILYEDGSSGYDLETKKGIFIQTAMDLNQEFFSLPPDLKFRMCELYNSHFSSSNIWKLDSQQAHHLYSAWNKNIKVIYDLPWSTHRWVIEEITGKSLQVMLLKRFLKFTSSILKTTKPFIKFLLRAVSADVRSNTGSNLRTILLKTGVQAVPGISGITMPWQIKMKRLDKVPGG